MPGQDRRHALRLAQRQREPPRLRERCRLLERDDEDATCRRAAQGLNIDGSTTTAYDSLTDGLMALRYLFGLRGAGLTANALSPTATRTEPVAIAAYLDSLRSSLDIDNNGVVDALTDGTLILRYMFGTRGSQLLAGAIGPGAANATAAGIEAKIRSLMP